MGKEVLKENKNVTEASLENLSKQVRTYLDSMEEYEDLSEMASYYDYYQFMDEACQTVWSISAEGGESIKIPYNGIFMPSAAYLDGYISRYMQKNNINPQTIPLIPMVQYKLVPTGEIEYFDPTLSRSQREASRKHKTSEGRKHTQQYHANETERKKVFKEASKQTKQLEEERLKRFLLE